jgi:hypothetical protein
MDEVENREKRKVPDKTAFGGGKWGDRPPGPALQA